MKYLHLKLLQSEAFWWPQRVFLQLIKQVRVKALQSKANKPNKNLIQGKSKLGGNILVSNILINDTLSKLTQILLNAFAT